MIVSRHLRRFIGVLCVSAAVAAVAAVPAGAGAGPSATGPTTVGFTQNTGTVTVTWGGGYFGPMLGLYPAGTTCPTAGIGDLPTAPTYSMGLSATTSPVVVSLSTTVVPGWPPNTPVSLPGGTYNFCMYNITYIGFMIPLPLFNLVNTSAWVGNVNASGPPSASDPSLPAPPLGAAPPPEDDESSAAPATPVIRSSFTG